MPVVAQGVAASGYSIRPVCPDRHDGTLHCMAEMLVPNAGVRRNAATPSGLTPADIGNAYKLNQTAGSGQTVAIVEGYRYGGSSTAGSQVNQDLAVYRSQFGLPPCTLTNHCLSELNQFGTSTTFPGDDPTDPTGNRIETMLDVEAVSATCPMCHIVMVYAQDLSPANVFTAVDTASAHGNEVSISLGSPESGLTMSDETADDVHFNHPGVAIVASSGDCGYGTAYPAASPYVTSVGGTSLVRDGSARGWSETVWNNGLTPSPCSGYPVTGQVQGTGSGCTMEAKPAYQPALPGTVCSNRLMNDIAAAADPSAGGFAEYNAVDGWTSPVGGTSESAPIVAGYYALSGGEGSFTGPQPLYSNRLFFDVTSGSNVSLADDCNNALCHASPGFDGPTGLGTPNGGGAVLPPLRSAPPPQGYWLVARDGGIFPFGIAAGLGSTGAIHLNQPIVGMAATADGGGYYLVASDGGIFPFGDAQQHSYGSTGGMHLNQPIAGMAVTGTGNGYYLIASDGGLFPFGDAQQHSYGSTGAMHLNQPIVGMAVTGTGNGYWMVARDGGMFPFGDACGCGGHGGSPLNRPILGMASTASGHGYWLVATDGGIFPYGDATQHSYGSTGGQQLNSPIVGMSRTVSGNGYRLVASDGGVFPFGDAQGLGSMGGRHVNQPIVEMASVG